ncbi:Myb- protein B [Mortierella alpina]|nr:Myb- protein B [Mortierella alpina]
MRLEGCTWKEIGEAIGRDHAACHSRYVRYLDPSLQAWTPQKCERLNALVASGKTWRQVSDELLMTQTIVREKWNSLNPNLVRHPKPKRAAPKRRRTDEVSSSTLKLGSLQETGLISVKRHRWCDHMDALLVDLRRRGLSWRQIGTVFGMVPMTCYMRYQYRLKPNMKSGWVPPEINSSNVPYYLLPNRVRPLPAPRAAPVGTESLSSPETNQANTSAASEPDHGSVPPSSRLEKSEATVASLGIVDEDFSYNVHDDFPSRVWSAEEDEQILQLRRDGASFSTIGHRLKVDARQCFHRYYTALDPALQHKEWTPEMVEKLRFYVEQGLAWTTISKDLGFHRLVCKEKYKEISRPRSSSSSGSHTDTSKLSDTSISVAGIESSDQRTEDDKPASESGDEEDQGQGDYDHGEEDDGPIVGDDGDDFIDDYQDDYKGTEADESAFADDDEDNDDLLNADASDDGERSDDNDQIRVGRRSGRSRRASEAEASSAAVRDIWDQSSYLRDIEKTWKPEEETALIQHVLRNGTRGWQDVSQALGGHHSPDECRAYWKHLDMPVRRAEHQPSRWDPHREAQFWRLWLENKSNFVEISRKLSKSRGSTENEPSKKPLRQSSVLTVFTPEDCEELFNDRIRQFIKADPDDDNKSAEEIERSLNKEYVDLAYARSKPPVFKWDKEKSVKLQKLVRQRLKTRGVQVNWINWNWVARHVGEGVTAQRCSVHWRTLRKSELENVDWTDEEVRLLEKGVREVGTLFNQDISPSASPTTLLTTGMDLASRSNGPTAAGLRAIQRFYIPDRQVESLQRKYFLLSDKATGVTVDEYMAIMDAVERYGDDQWDEVVKNLRTPSDTAQPSSSTANEPSTAGSSTAPTTAPGLAGWTKGPCRRVWESSYKHHVLYTPWSQEEDQDLKAVVDSIGQADWLSVSRFFPAKSAWQCRLRWCQLTDPLQASGTTTANQESASLPAA